jgi:hypothetical protein
MNSLAALFKLPSLVCDVCVFGISNFEIVQYQRYDVKERDLAVDIVQ